MTTTDNAIILYQSHDGAATLEVRLDHETVLLAQDQMAELFGRERSVITKHLRNVFKEGELEEISVRANYAHTAADGKEYLTQFYNLDAILRLFPFMLLMLLTLLLPALSRAEFYSYEDSSGTIHFVDDLAKIPLEFRQHKQVRKDRYDDLPEAEHALMLERDRRERDTVRKKEADAQTRALQARKAAVAQAAYERQQEELFSPVVISGRQVFVPVKLKNGSAETDALLLLDTGASMSVITPEVAARLKIGETSRIRVSVVGGRVLNAKRLLLSEIQVGPVRREGQEVVIISQRSGTKGDGLLGMSFLGGLKYTIDFQKQRLNWLQ